MEYHPVYICRGSQECVVASSHDSRSRPLYLSLKDSSDHGLSRPGQAPTTSLSSNDSRTAKSTSRMARRSTSLAVPKSSLTTSSRTTSALLPSPLRRLPRRQLAIPLSVCNHLNTGPKRRPSVRVPVQIVVPPATRSTKVCWQASFKLPRPPQHHRYNPPRLLELCTR